jgi:ABC-type antimicrobial peptide transport system permease subunit
VTIGLAASFVASGLLTTLLFRVSRADSATYAAVVALVIAVAILASALPAWRAARVDPVQALRSE